MLLRPEWKKHKETPSSTVLFYLIMADECTDVFTIEELSIYCRWKESKLTEHFIEIVPPKNTDAENVQIAQCHAIRHTLACT